MVQKSVVLDYKLLFDACLVNSSSLFIILNNDLSINSISPMVTKLFSWNEEVVKNKKIADLFSKYAVEPFIDVTNPFEKCNNISNVSYDNANLQIDWSVEQFFNNNQICDYIFLIGNISNRLFSKLAAESEVRGDEARRTAVYTSVHEDSSTESTKQFPSAVEFRKKSNEKKTVRKEVVSELPQNDAELFVLDDFPILDIEKVKKSINYDNDLLKDILLSIADDEIPRDLALLKNYREEANWDEIEKIAHKMKGGAMYCGTTKMQYACMFFEKYKKSGKNELFERLYEQLFRISNETRDTILSWIVEQKHFFQD